MEKNKSSKIIAIIALIVAVIGLSIGFAAFSRVLTIQSSAEVKTDESVFSVKFSSSSDKVATDPITANTVTSSASAENATISGTTISGLKVHFTKPGQSATYTFYAYNDGGLDAFLKAINFSNSKTCTPTATGAGKNPGTNALVQTACNDIVLSVNVASSKGEESTPLNGITSTNSSISEHKLPMKKSQKIDVVIAYSPEGKVADGDFDVTFGDITLTYQTSD